MKTICPHCGKPVDPARMLARRARGMRKKFSKDEIKARTARLAEARKKRWI